jgi:hypothetical protein
LLNAFLTSPINATSLAHANFSSMTLISY